MIRWVLLLSILFGFLATPSYALETENMALYEVDEPVADQTEKARKRAAKRALLRQKSIGWCPAQKVLKVHERHRRPPRVLRRGTVPTGRGQSHSYCWGKMHLPTLRVD